MTNRQIKTATIDVLIIAVKLSHYPRRTELLGSLSYSMRGNLSNLADFIIGIISYYIKEFWGSERDFLAEVDIGHRWYSFQAGHTI